MTMHEGGEVDVRGCYCALAACHMLGMDRGAAAVAAACGLRRFVAACQSHEGGIGGEPWNEAHGGYTFCGYAALVLAGMGGGVDRSRLQRWAARMQGWMEGGFQGRTNKLVDGCYSLWQGGIFPLLRFVGEDGGTQGDGNAVKGAPQERAGRAAAEEELRGTAAAVVAAEVLAGEADLAAVLQGEAQPPALVALGAVDRAQRALDSAVEETLKREEAYQAAAAQGTPDTTPAQAAAKAAALAALQAASDAQDALNRAKQHVNSAECAATVLLKKSSSSGGPDRGGDDGGLLYDARALQVWLLVACQVGRGGLRDKPGKHADYYHTCYCLSGLSSAQTASGVVLGGERNRLAPADPLCNVVVDKLQEARAHYGLLGEL